MRFDARIGTVAGLVIGCGVVSTAPVVMAEREHAPAFSCTVCEAYYQTRAEFNKHQIAAHGATGCFEHGVLFKERVEADRHAVLVHGARECRQCGLHFHDLAAAREHVIKKHPLPPPKGVKTRSAASSAGKTEPPPGKARKAPAEKAGEGPSPK